MFVRKAYHRRSCREDKVHIFLAKPFSVQTSVIYRYRGLPWSRLFSRSTSSGSSAFQKNEIKINIHRALECTFDIQGKTNNFFSCNILQNVLFLRYTPLVLKPLNERECFRESSLTRLACNICYAYTSNWILFKTNLNYVKFDLNFQSGFKMNFNILNWTSNYVNFNLKPSARV